MEIHARRIRNVEVKDQENRYVTKKDGVAIPTKRLGLNVRGALGELNTNTTVHSQSDVKGKDSCEIEKISARRIVRSYKNVQSKVDTGLTAKSTVQPSCRPPLRREESTGRLAVRAVVTRAALKDAQNKPNELKESTNVFVQPKKIQEKKKLPVVKEVKSLLKPAIREPTESLGKLKLSESKNTPLCNKELEKPEDIVPELPANIEDIDAGDSNNAFLMSYYIKDIYKYLTDLEEKYSIQENYLAKQTVITGKMRATLIDWLVEVQKQFTLELETFHMTVGIIDRYLQAVPNVPRNQLQLVGVTAMFIASKYEEVYAPNVDDFVFITDKAYTKHEIFRCERDMMKKLSCSLARPIPLHFLRRFIKAAHGSSRNHHLAKYFVDLCLVDYSMVHYRPSELAAAAICLSLYVIPKQHKDFNKIWTPTLEYYSGYTLKHIQPIFRKMAKLVTNVENSNHKAVYNKYLDVTLAKVSSLPELKSEIIQELAKNA